MNGSVRGIHRGRQHGQSNGREHLEGAVSHDGPRHEPQGHGKPGDGRGQARQLGAGSGRSLGDRADVPAGLPRRRGHVSRARRPRGERQARNHPHRPEQRAALDAEKDRAGRQEARRAFPRSTVSGGVSGARAATLAIMVGGEAEPLSRARPVLLAMGPNIFHVGPVGAGNTVKAINNMMACVNGLAMMEGLALGVKAGLDAMTIYEVVKASSGGSKALERIPRAIVPREFEPGFKVALMNKDLETFTAIAKELHVPVSFVNVAQRYEQMALAAGLGEQDTTVVMTVIERLAGIQVPRGKAAS